MSARGDYKRIEYPEGWEPNEPKVEFYIGNLPQRHNVERIFELDRAGYTPAQIAVDLLAHTKNGKRHKIEKQRMVERILREGVSKWDWVDDEVAVTRAYAGDREVWKNLTFYERSRVLEMLSHVSMENPHRLASGNFRALMGRADDYVDREAHGSTSRTGLIEWSFAVGEHPQRIIDMAISRAGRRSARERRAAA